MLENYNLEYCKQFDEVKLRKIYNGEDSKVLDALVKECCPKKAAPKKEKKESK